MVIVYEWRQLKAALIFDVIDQLALERGTRGPHPRAFGDLRFRLVARDDAGTLSDLAPPHELAVVPNPSGYQLFFDRYRRPDGRHQRTFVPDGTYVLRVDGDFYQPSDDIRVDVSGGQLAPAGTLDIDQPEHEVRNLVRVQLRPGPRYPFVDRAPAGRLAPGTNCGRVPTGSGPTLLRGSLHALDGESLSGALVEVRELPGVVPCRTDSTGDWLLVFPAGQVSRTVTVRITEPGGAFHDVAGVCVVRGRELSLHETALRGTVLRGGRGMAGAQVQVAGRPGVATTRTNGGWFYYFNASQPDGSVTVTARLPSAESRSVLATVQSRATVIVPVIRFP